MADSDVASGRVGPRQHLAFQIVGVQIDDPRDQVVAFQILGAGKVGLRPGTGCSTMMPSRSKEGAFRHLLRAGRGGRW